MSLFVQKWQTDFLGALSNKEVQQALIKFLVASWEDDANPNIIQDFQIYVSCGNLFFSFKTEGEKVKKSSRDFSEMFTCRSRFWDVIQCQIYKCTKWSCHKNSWYRNFSYYSLEHAKTFSRVESIIGSWLTSNKYNVLYKCERNKQKSCIQILLYYTWLSCFHWVRFYCIN